MVKLCTAIEGISYAKTREAEIAWNLFGKLVLAVIKELRRERNRIDTACVNGVDFDGVPIIQTGVNELNLEVTAITPQRLRRIEANVAVLIIGECG